MKKKILYIIIVIFIFIAFASTVSLEWLYETFGHLSMDEIIFHIKFPMTGVNTDIIFSFINECLIKIFLPVILISFVLIYLTTREIKLKNNYIMTQKQKNVVILLVALLILMISIVRILIMTDIIEYISGQLHPSTFIEQEYVEPSTAKIEFPEEKRNLIYIYLESMETTYYSKEEGGMSQQNLIPEIAQLAKENISFSNTDKLGGAHSLYGTTWTTGAMSAQSLGLPLKMMGQNVTNGILKDIEFLPGAYGIGEILEKEGYHNYLLLGSDADFGGRKSLYLQHGNYEIWDYTNAVEEEIIKEPIWWGYNDDLLFEIAKEKITNLAQEDRPFNFTMLTADTHFPDGYVCKDCEDKWDEQYKNVISCSSKKVGKFVEWIKEQEFFENTTVIIVGDHLTMQTNFFELEEDQEYDKTVVNIIINPAVETKNTINRQYSTIDLYPTTLVALGATIEGEKLALGTNLFSNEQTLIEKYGLEYVNNELKKASNFYKKDILKIK